MSTNILNKESVVQLLSKYGKILKIEYYNNGYPKYVLWEDLEERYFNIENKLHRINGPALISKLKNENEYYVNGKRIDVSSDEELIIKLLLE